MLTEQELNIKRYNKKKHRERVLAGRKEQTLIIKNLKNPRIAPFIQETIKRRMVWWRRLLIWLKIIHNGQR